MGYLLLEYQNPKKGYIGGSATFDPELSDTYSAFVFSQKSLSEDTIVTVELHSSVKKLDVDFFHTTNFGLFLSTDFKDLLEDKVTDLVQFLPAKVYYHNRSQVSKEYWLIHNIEILDCLDYDLSDYAEKSTILDSLKNPPRRFADEFKKIILDDKKVENYHIFKLAHTYIVNPIISRELYEQAKKKKLKLYVTPIEQYAPLF